MTKKNTYSSQCRLLFRNFIAESTYLCKPRCFYLDEAKLPEYVYFSRILLFIVGNPFLLQSTTQQWKMSMIHDSCGLWHGSLRRKRYCTYTFGSIFFAVARTAYQRNISSDVIHFNHAIFSFVQLRHILSYFANRKLLLKRL